MPSQRCDAMQCDHHNWQLLLLHSNVAQVLIRFFVVVVLCVQEWMRRGSVCLDLGFSELIHYGKSHILKIENSTFFQILCDKPAPFSTTLDAKSKKKKKIEVLWLNRICDTRDLKMVFRNK